MPLRIWRRFQLVPGVRMNLSRRGASLSLGHRGFWYTLGSHGHRVTAGIPGTGIYWTERGRHVHHGHRLLPPSCFWWCSPRCFIDRFPKPHEDVTGVKWPGAIFIDYGLRFVLVCAWCSLRVERLITTTASVRCQPLQRPGPSIGRQRNQSVDAGGSC